MGVCASKLRPVYEGCIRGFFLFVTTVLSVRRLPSTIFQFGGTHSLSDVAQAPK